MHSNWRARPAGATSRLRQRSEHRTSHGTVDLHREVHAGIVARPASASSRIASDTASRRLPFQAAGSKAVAHSPGDTSMQRIGLSG